MKKEIIEIGFVAMYKAKFWGVEYEDSQCCSNGWVEFDKARLCDERFCHKPTDMTNENNHYELEELKKASLVRVERKTTIELKAI